MIVGFKKAHEDNNYEFKIPTIKQLKMGFQGLSDDRERALYLMFITSGLRKSELLQLKKVDLDFNLRIIKSKHDTRTKKGGITVYNQEAQTHLQRYILNRRDNDEKLFMIGTRQFIRILNLNTDYDSHYVLR